MPSPLGPAHLCSPNTGDVLREGDEVLAGEGSMCHDSDGERSCQLAVSHYFYQCTLIYGQNPSHLGIFRPWASQGRDTAQLLASQHLCDGLGMDPLQEGLGRATP